MKKRAGKMKKQNNADMGGLFIPAGLFIGMGFGFLYGVLVEGLFIGLGAGFLLFALTHLFKRKK